jgi:hypothetical protein
MPSSRSVQEGATSALPMNLQQGRESALREEGYSARMNKLPATLITSLFSLSAFGDKAVTPGAPQMIDGQPAMYFGVMSCGRTVLWVLLTNGHVFRIDDAHAQRDKEEFMKRLAGAKSDIVEILCPAIA